jgi:predicted MFS family arabinose efflux permease
VRQSLRLPAFRRILVAYTLNELAWTVGTLALTVLVYHHTGSALGAMVFFLCSQFLPALLAPSLVARIDQSSPRRVLPALYALEALLFGALAWVASRFSLPAILALTVADGAVATAARALANATRVELLKPVDLLHEGNALVNTLFSLSFLAGPLIGGAVVALGGTVSALLANCALFALMALSLATANLPPSGADGPKAGRLRASIAHARSDRPLLVLLVLHGIGLVFFTISMPVEIVYVSHSLHGGPAIYGALLSAWGGGAVAGSGIYARWRRGQPTRLISSSAAVIGVGFALMAVAPSIAVALAGAALGGIGNGVESVSMQTAIQERTPERWMALIMSLNEAIVNVSPGLGILLGGVITALTSPRVGLAAAGAGSLAFAVLALVSLRSAGISSGRGTPDPEGPEGTTTSPGPEGTTTSPLARSERLV